MNRRSLLKTIGAFFVARRVVFGTRAAAASSGAAQATAFAPAEVATLNAIAEVVLPSSLTADDRRLAVRAFTTWFANYRQGADMGHGYGSSALRAPAGPSPSARSPPHCAALEAAAAARGAKTFGALLVAARREVIEAALNTPQPVNRMPASPTGANLVADFMGSYFNSQDGWNLCYRAEINRDSCRTLDDSARAPRAIRG